MDKKEDIIKFSISTLSIIKKTYFIKNKKLKPFTDKLYKDKKKFSKEIKIIFIKIIKIHILILIKNLITFKIISFK